MSAGSTAGSARRAVAAAAAKINALPAPALVLGGIISVQVGAAVATGLIHQLGPVLTLTLRLDIAAVVMLLAVRPSLRNRSRRDWGVMLALGLSLVAMNLTYYNAIARLPLGVVTTIEFLGPLGLAASLSRRPRDLVAVAVALVGVAAVSGILTHSLDRLDPVGLVFTIAAGIAWAAYIVCTRAVGRHWRQLDGLALAMTVAAVVVTPLGIASAGPVQVTAGHVAAGALVAVMSSVVPYSLQLLALRRIDARVFGILLSLEPAVAAMVGFLVLGQSLAAAQLVGMALVVAASAMVMTAQHPTAAEEAAELG